MTLSKYLLAFSMIAGAMAHAETARSVLPGLSVRARSAMRLLGLTSAAELADRFTPDMLRRDRRIDAEVRKELVRWARGEGFEFRRPLASAADSERLAGEISNPKILEFMKQQGFVNLEELSRRVSARDLARGHFRNDIKALLELVDLAQRAGYPLRTGAVAFAKTCEDAWTSFDHNNIRTSEYNRVMKTRDPVEFARNFSVKELIEIYRMGFGTALDLADWAETCGSHVSLTKEERLATNARLCVVPLTQK